MRAADLMSSPVICVRESCPVLEIAETLQTHRITGVVVVDDQGLAVGMVGEADLLHQVARPHLPPHIQLLGSVIYLQAPSRLDLQLRRIAGTQASHLMSTPVHGVTEETAVEDVASLLLDKKIHRVPVLREGVPVGIITQGDVLRRALLKALRAGAQTEQTDAS